MRSTVEIENIEELRRREGINDVELRAEIRNLEAGGLVKLTFMTGTVPATGETLLVRITSIRGSCFRGRLLGQPVSARLSPLHAGSLIAFTRDHIHSIAGMMDRS